MPAADYGHGHPQQIGQHGRRVKPVDIVLRVDQPQPLPELRFGNDLDGARFDLLPRGLVEPVVLIARFGKREFVLADDDQIGRCVGFFQHGGSLPANQLRGVAFCHAGQLAHKRNAFVLQNPEDVFGGRHGDLRSRMLLNVVCIQQTGRMMNRYNIHNISVVAIEDRVVEHSNGLWRLVIRHGWQSGCGPIGRLRLPAKRAPGTSAGAKRRKLPSLTARITAIG